MFRSMKRVVAMVTRWVSKMLLLAALYVYEQSAFAVCSTVILRERLDSGDVIQVRMELQEYVSGVDKLRDKRFTTSEKVWGVDGYLPDTVLNRLSFSVGNLVVEIPADAISDLANIVGSSISASRSQSNAELAIMFKGGDGSGSFEAQFFVHDDGPFVRRIYTRDNEGRLIMADEKYVEMK